MKELTGPSASFQCALCERTASVVFVNPGEFDPNALAGTEQPPGLEWLMTDVPRLSIRGGPVTITHALLEPDPDAVSAAVAAGDLRALCKIDWEFVPFWCPECDACYCSDHYTHWDEYDDSFFDCTRGRCPRGHERMLMD